MALPVLFTITVWGTAFAATKTLLNHYDALQVMLMRFFIAWVVLSMLTRKIEKPKRVRDELGIFALEYVYCRRNYCVGNAKRFFFF